MAGLDHLREYKLSFVSSEPFLLPERVRRLIGCNPRTRE